MKRHIIGPPTNSLMTVLHVCMKHHIIHRPLSPFFCKTAGKAKNKGRSSTGTAWAADEDDEEVEEEEDDEELTVKKLKKSPAAGRAKGVKGKRSSSAADGDSAHPASFRLI